MNEDQNSKCHKIIHTAAASAGAIAAGLAQIPGSDAIPITGIQVAMIISLGAVFGRDVSESTAKSLLGGAIAAVGGRTVSQFLVGWLPGIGNAINATTAFTITEALGWLVANNFSEEAEKQAEEERLAREEAERKAQKEAEKKPKEEAGRLAQEKAERKAQIESEKQTQSNTEKTEEQPAQTILQKEASIPAQAKQNSYKSHISLCIVFSCVFAAVCMLVDAGLENFTLHFKIWGAVSGIILAVVCNVVICTIRKNKGWSEKIRPMVSYSNVLAMVINLFFALVISSENDALRWDNVHSWEMKLLRKI